MTSPYPARQPKRLERSKSNRGLGGVCAGVANYLNMDPTLVRVLTVLLTLFTGVPVVVYLVLLLVVPEEDSSASQPSYPPVGPADAQQGKDPVWGPTGAPWEQQPPATQPAQTQPAPEPKSTDPDPGQQA
jgi:phage shock protein PspC (stress-responsive transcriptional regulator)